MRGSPQFPRTISRETLILTLRGICGGPRNSLAKVKRFHWLANRFLANHSQTLRRICEAIYFYIYKGREFERKPLRLQTNPKKFSLVYTSPPFFFSGGSSLLRHRSSHLSCLLRRIYSCPSPLIYPSFFAGSFFFCGGSPLLRRLRCLLRWFFAGLFFFSGGSTLLRRCPSSPPLSSPASFRTKQCNVSKLSVLHSVIFVIIRVSFIDLFRVSIYDNSL